MILVRTPRSAATESLMGYVLRVSEANGYDSPLEMLKYAGLRQSEKRTIGFPTDKLAAIMGRTPGSLDHIAYSSTKEHGFRSMKILSHDLGGSPRDRPLRLKRPAFCPECVRKTGYIDAFWDLSAAIACPRHRCLALDQCPACGESLGWFRPGLLTCSCGQDLSGISTEAAPTGLVSLMAVVDTKLHGGSWSGMANANGFPMQALEQLSLGGLLAIMLRLGRFDALSKGGPCDSDPYSSIESTAEVLSDWPQSYHRFLHRLGAFLTQDQPPVFGLRRRYDRFYEVMFKPNSLAAREASFLYDEFIQFGLAVLGKVVVDRKLLSGRNISRESRFYSLSEAAHLANIAPNTIKYLIQKGLLGAKKIQVGTQVRYVLDQEAIDLAKQTPGKTFGIKAAAAQLGIPVNVLSALRKSGHFAVNHMSAPKKQRGFHERDIACFRKTMLERSTLVNPQRPRHEPVFSLGYVLKQLPFWSKTGKSDFVAAYLDGAIESVGRTGDSLKHIHFRKTDVELYVRIARENTSNDAVSKTEAAAAIGCGFPVIQRLIDEGYLTGHHGPDRIRVERQSLKNFRDSYIGLGVVAKSLGTSSRRLHRLCTNAKIDILSVPFGKRDLIASFIRCQDHDALLRVEQIEHQNNPAFEARQQRWRARKKRANALTV